MASHVFVISVIEGRIRKAKVPTTLATSLSDVLSEGCSKLGLHPNDFTLKYKGKYLELSLIMRLTNLSSGAQIDLAPAPKSPTVISVKLQFEDQQFVEKFLSNISLWQVLRIVETQNSINFTERSTPSTTTQGSGRLLYEMPAISYMNREFSTLVGLQKTLSQAGFRESASLRLSFKKTDMPLEDAIANISTFFTPEVIPMERSLNLTSTPQYVNTSPNQLKENVNPAEIIPSVKPSGTTAGNIISPIDSRETSSAIESSSDIPSSQCQILQSKPEPLVTVYLPSMHNTIVAARKPTDEDDFMPTAEHAALHQKRLLDESRNKPLLSDAKIAANSAAAKAALAAISSVPVRVRCPDGTFVETKLIRSEATGRHLYKTVRAWCREDCIHGWQIWWMDAKGKSDPLKENDVNLIANMGWNGKMRTHIEWNNRDLAKSKEGKPFLTSAAIKDAQPISQSLYALEDQSKYENNGGILTGITKALNLSKKNTTRNRADKEAKLLGWMKK